MAFSLHLNVIFLAENCTKIQLPCLTDMVCQQLLPCRRHSFFVSTFDHYHHFTFPSQMLLMTMINDSKRECVCDSCVYKLWMIFSCVCVDCGRFGFMIVLMTATLSIHWFSLAGIGVVLYFLNIIYISIRIHFISLLHYLSRRRRRMKSDIFFFQ